MRRTIKHKKKKKKKKEQPERSTTILVQAETTEKRPDIVYNSPESSHLPHKHIKKKKTTKLFLNMDAESEGVQPVQPASAASDPEMIWLHVVACLCHSHRHWPQGVSKPFV
ncbi:hypothetical protein EVAR_101697_1 [Eumeta japonica]|uniref:Uncharacterized protein n=1 Tax=Eumeta variegata TaxID=151549 RepID=A0A4C1STC9_EUMVA|nr:hypothetical protein EVAR_101697_1 [Eumeta japonica]